MFLRRKQRQSHPLTPDEGIPSPESRRQEIQGRIHYLTKQIRYSKWWMALFFLFSLCAAVDFRFFPPISEKTRQFLGASPSPTLISIALIVYAFSALILILGHMNTGSVRFRGWSHIGYLSAFYLFYYYTGVLRENFWPVFIAGLTILGLESYRVWSACSEAIRMEKEILASVKK
ncbi:MAG: menaquinol oxidoreductase [Deltaproteobacteria bacterium]|nr:menaquinol oxidoreductase [Candidatus Anaeroferrophillus wilburensis]MBN2889787.1 menaquinol oxidoreductase [Deltaproteobacteria bacterium]